MYCLLVDTTKVYELVKTERSYSIIKVGEGPPYSEGDEHNDDNTSHSAENATKHESYGNLTSLTRIYQF